MRNHQQPQQKGILSSSSSPLISRMLLTLVCVLLLQALGYSQALPSHLVPSISTGTQQQPTALVNAPSPSSVAQFASSNVTSLSFPSKLNANNVLEALSSMGKAIQQQVAAASSQFQIAPASNEFIGTGNVRKNEYQSVQEQLQPVSGADNSSGQALQPNYREQGEVLRQEILRRAGHLQQVVGSSLEMLRNNSDLIVRRLLEQLNHRLDQAKSKADRIISEPATNELAVRTLTTINLGLNNLNTMINNIVTRLEASAREQQQQQLVNNAGSQQRNSFDASKPPTSQLDPNKLRLNLAQLREHFSSAINAAHQQQKQLQLKLAQTQPAHLAPQAQQLGISLNNPLSPAPSKLGGQ